MSCTVNFSHCLNQQMESPATIFSEQRQFSLAEIVSCQYKLIEPERIGRTKVLSLEPEAGRITKSSFDRYRGLRGQQILFPKSSAARFVAGAQAHVDWHQRGGLVGRFQLNSETERCVAASPPWINDHLKVVAWRASL